VLRWLIVTPDMHRVHHSLVPAETDSNYGFNLSLWDRLFRTYRARAAKPDFTLGLEHFQNDAPNGLWFVFALPFRGGPRR
jgi:sterol desaturase/sphingolipid hydroxylase (fatty acid hydroxylase superfamily)